nr:hypothetical protein [Bacteroidota bacterium]
MKKGLLFLGLIVIIGFSANAQTNPTPQTLPYSQDFNGLLHSSTVFPNGWQGWVLGGGVSTIYKTTPATANEALVANGGANSAAGAIYNFNEKIGFLPSGTKDPALALSIETLCKKDITVIYNVMVMRDPFNGTTNTRINEVSLQYRVGTSGNFTNLTGISYQNTGLFQNSGTTGQNILLKSVILPSVCDSQAVVQLRWVVRDVSGNGNRPSFAIDDISINGLSLAPVQPTAITGLTTVCDGATETYEVAAVTGATSYTWTLPTDWTGTSTTNTIAATALITGGNVMVTANNACGSSTAQTLAVIVDNIPAQPSAITGLITVCDGAIETYEVAAVTGATSYTWTLPTDWTGTSTTNTIAATALITGGNVSVTANNACGSSSAQTLAVSIDNVPAQPSAITGLTTLCSGTVETYEVTAVTGATSYTWTLPTDWTGSS